MCENILGSFAYSFLAEFDNSDQVLKLPSTSLVLEVAFSGSNIGLALHHEKNLNMIKSWNLGIASSSNGIWIVYWEVCYSKEVKLQLNFSKTFEYYIRELTESSEKGRNFKLPLKN